MATLPSQLDELVADDEDLARFLTSSSQYSSRAIKPGAFLPNPKDRETSAFRHGAEPRPQLWQLAEENVAGERTLHGAAIVKARNVRAAKLTVVASEPPPRHAAIIGWPWIEADPDEQKAQQKELAAVLASTATLVLR